MSAISWSISRGLLNFPRSDPASKAVAEQLLKKDFESHHCYFHAAGFHNHLNHHVLAAYDLGAPASLIQAIYDEEAKTQRPIDLNENGAVPEGVPGKGEITETNWREWVGDPNAYSAYAAFFSTEISRLGIARTLEDYIFAPAANGNGLHMLLRLFGGVLHPFLQIGHGVEFDSEIQVAAGMAQTAVHDAFTPLYVNPADFIDAVPYKETKGSQPRVGASILSLLQQIYDSPKLTPVLPYEPNASPLKRYQDVMKLDGGSRITELKRIFTRFDPGHTHEDLDARVEELLFVSTLLTFATGKKGRMPRLDFFLMHLLTSTLFVPSFFKYIPSIENKRALLRTFLQSWGVDLIARGRPRIDPALLMSYTGNPVPPNPNLLSPNAHVSAIFGEDMTASNPWLAVVSDALHAPDPHTLKTVRSLMYAAARYGTVPKGSVVGAFGTDGKETHRGIAEVDGSIFVRSAGILMDTLGWVTHGQPEGGWDRSGLGWDDAWAIEDSPAVPVSVFIARMKPQVTDASESTAKL